MSPTPAENPSLEKTTPRRLGIGVIQRDGFSEGETPTYQSCVCGQLVRVDRLDLLAEHRDSCRARPSTTRW